MTEAEYIAVANLARLRAAQHLLSEIVSQFSNERDALRKAQQEVNALVEMAQSRINIG